MILVYHIFGITDDFVRVPHRSHINISSHFGFRIYLASWIRKSNHLSMTVQKSWGIRFVDSSGIIILNY